MTEKELAKLITDTLHKYSKYLTPGELKELRGDLYQLVSAAKKVEGQSWMNAIAEGTRERINRL